MTEFSEKEIQLHDKTKKAVIITPIDENQNEESKKFDLDIDDVLTKIMEKWRIENETGNVYDT